MATYQFTLTGDQVATYTKIKSSGNGQNKSVEIQGVETLGSSSDTYTLVVEDHAGKGPVFADSQKVTLYDSDGNVVFANLNPKTSQFGGLGAGDEHVIFTGGNQKFIIDLGGFDGDTVTYTADDEVADPDVGDNDGELDFEDIPCFVPGTTIRTPKGERKVEDLKDGDKILTVDSGTVPILWIRSREVDFRKTPKRRRPVLFKNEGGEPLTVSAQHRMLQNLDGQEVLIPAIGLVDKPGVREKKGARKVIYYSLMTPMHEIIWANGIPCETFYPGEYILAAMPKDLRDEVYSLRPLLRFGAELGYGPGVRPFVTPRGKWVGNAVRKRLKRRSVDPKNLAGTKTRKQKTKPGPT